MGHAAYDTAPAGGGARPAPPAAAPPRVWVLLDDKLGHSTQSLGLADALGWPYETKALRFTPLNRLSNRLLGAGLLALDRRRSAALEPPWPELVIATGRRSAPVARWIAARQPGHTRLVQLGRKGVDRAEHFDLNVTCAHYGLPAHPRRLETVAPLAAISSRTLHDAAARWRDLFGDAPRPHVALLVGGSSALHRLDAETAARLGEEVVNFTAAAGGTLQIVTSPRTGAAAAAALRGCLRAQDRCYEWRRGDPANPYHGCLAVADVLVVTGDSESMLAEAAATTAPLYIYPLPARRGALRQRLRAWVGARASRPEASDHDPIARACAALLARGVVRPPRDLDVLYRQLIAHGVARPFGAPLALTRRAPLNELEAVAARVRALFAAGAPEATR